MTTTLGRKTLSTFEQGPEAHKLFVEFQADGVIHKGQPVVMHADGDKVTAATASSTAAKIIGVSIHEGNSAYGDYVTIAMKAFVVIQAKAAEAFIAGPCAYTGYDTEDAYPGNQKEFGGYNLVGDLAGSAAAQVTTVTVAGASGTLDITMGGLTKSVDFVTSTTATAAAFVTAHAAAYATLGITVTSSGAGILFTAAVAGNPFNIGEATNRAGDLAGTVVETTDSESASGAQFGWALDKATHGNDVIRVAVSG